MKEVLILMGCLALAGCGNAKAKAEEERRAAEIRRLEVAIQQLRQAQSPENRPLSAADVEYRLMLVNLHKAALNQIESDKLKLEMEKERVRYASDTHYCQDVPKCASYEEHVARNVVRPCIHAGCPGASCPTCGVCWTKYDCCWSADGARKAGGTPAGPGQERQALLNALALVKAVLEGR